MSAHYDNMIAVSKKDPRLVKIIHGVTESWMPDACSPPQDPHLMLENMLFGASCGVFAMEGAGELYDGIVSAMRYLEEVGADKFVETVS